MRGNSGEWMLWGKNPPSASNMGGLWERQIRSVRNISFSLSKTHGTSLSDVSLHISLIEGRAVVNSRPLTTNLSNDIKLTA